MSNEWSGKRIRELQRALSECKTEIPKLNRHPLLVEDKPKKCVNDVEKTHNRFFEVKDTFNNVSRLLRSQLYIARWNAFKSQISVMVIKVYRLLQKLLRLGG